MKLRVVLHQIAIRRCVIAYSVKRCRIRRGVLLFVGFGMTPQILRSQD